MGKLSAAVVAIVCATAAPGSAGTISQLNSFVPGQPTAFQFRLPALNNLGSYNVEFVLASESGVAGVDFYFDPAATAPATVGYVFPSSGSFLAAANVLTPTKHSITLSDFSLVGVDVVPGVNDFVATVAFRTSGSFRGLLTLALGEDSLLLDTPAATPTPVSTFAAARSTIATDANVAVPPLPEPSAIVLSLTALMIGRCIDVRRPSVVARSE